MRSSLPSGVIQGPPLPPADWGGGGSGGGSPEGRGADRRASFIGLFLLLAATGMVFAALSMAFWMRQSTSDDWVSMHKPPLLWVNTAVLLASSAVLDRARVALKQGRRDSFNFWWTGATALGVVFLIGQGIVWHQLSSAGVFIASSPTSSFFYLLTAAHAAHLLGGLGALVYVDVQALRLRLGPAKRTAIDVTAVFWHFLDGAWLYLMVLLYVWG
ncbi:MAG: cytochrome c oxidase subunit 3 [Bryobacteraceae bacterium]